MLDDIEIHLIAVSLMLSLFSISAALWRISSKL